MPQEGGSEGRQRAGKVPLGTRTASQAEGPGRDRLGLQVLLCRPRVRVRAWEPVPHLHADDVLPEGRSHVRSGARGTGSGFVSRRGAPVRSSLWREV